MRLAEIALAWCAYFALHSLLAATSTKTWVNDRWPHLMPGYRAAYNVFSVVALLPVLWLVYSTAGDWLWRWTGALAWVATGLSLAALLGFFVSTRFYDMGEFLGLSQLKQHAGDDRQTCTLSVFHRFVRHPWYCFGLVLVWTRDMNAPLLVSAAVITLYFIVGSRLEERKLIAQYGKRYQDYIARVPGLMPLPWKYLTAKEAEELIHPQAPAPRNQLS
jgi:protein-S-isoprenylcysteine O-methyltransferase Ste14